MSRRLKYATFCSGIECMSVACRGLPLNPVFFSEIEPFPCAVLKANYPTIPNLGDMSKIRRDENGNITNGTTTIPFPDGGIDILAAGCPCQDFSVAGKRAGGAEGSGTRSSLIFEFIRIIGEIRPRWFIYENVVGMLSTNEGRDFAHILLAFRDCGYSVAYRTLDAQHVRVDGMERAVPQRRRRVWVVGCLGADESLAGKILFEPDCVAGHTAPRRRTGEGFAYSLAGCDRVDAPVVDGAPGAGGKGELPCLDMMGGKPGSHFTQDGSSPTLTRGRGSVNDVHAIALDGDKLKPREDQRKGGNGFGVNEEGAGYTLTAVDRHGVAYGIGNGQAAEASATIRECSQTLNCMHDKQATVQCYENHAQDSRIKPIEVSDTRNQKDGTGGNNLPLVCFSKVSHPSAPNGKGERWDEREVAQTRNTFDNGEKRCQEVVVSMAQNTRDEVRIIGGDGQIAGALPAEPGMKQQTYVVSTNAIEGGDGRNQERIVSTAYKLDSTASNSMKSANPHSGFHETDVAACLDTTPPDPSKNQGGNVIVSTNSNGGDVAATINANMSKLGGDNQTTFGGGYVMTRNLSASGATCSTPERTPPSPPTSASASSRPSPQEPRRAQSAQG